MTGESVREKVAVVLQDSALFDESILYNIMYGKEGSSEEEAMQVRGAQCPRQSAAVQRSAARGGSLTSPQGSLDAVALFGEIHHLSLFPNPRPSILDPRPQTLNSHAYNQAARAAQLGQVILGLKDGYQSRVGERGGTLSGGQKQRVSIARALIKVGPHSYIPACI